MKKSGLSNTRVKLGAHGVDRHVMARIAPFGAYVLFMVLADLLERLGWKAQELLWLYPAKVTLVALLLWRYWATYHELRGQTSVSFRTLALGLVTGTLVFVVWVTLDAEWMTLGTPGGFDPRREESLDWALVAVRLGGAALVVPIMEELFWRSFLLRWLVNHDFLRVQPACVTFVAFSLSALFFAIEHHFWFAGLIAGAAFNTLYMRTVSLWCAVTAHAVANALLGIWVLNTGSWTYW
jgi:CAAX prenyl protease-like protein